MPNKPNLVPISARIQPQTKRKAQALAQNLKIKESAVYRLIVESYFISDNTGGTQNCDRIISN